MCSEPITQPPDRWIHQACTPLEISSNYRIPAPMALREPRPSGRFVQLDDGTLLAIDGNVMRSCAPAATPAARGRRARRTKRPAHLTGGCRYRVRQHESLEEQPGPAPEALAATGRSTARSSRSCGRSNQSATTLAVSLDGVMAHEGRGAASQASRNAGCGAPHQGTGRLSGSGRCHARGTAVEYVACGADRKPRRQPSAEVNAALEQRPDLRLVKLADAADNSSG